MSFETESEGAQLNHFQNFRYHPAHSLTGSGIEKTSSPAGGRKTSERADSLRRDDMEVRGPGFVSGASPIHGVQRTQGPSEVASKSPLEVPQDEIEISAAGQLMGKLTEATDASQRAERLVRIKAEIDSGSYDTEAKLEAALMKMFDKHGIDLEG